MKYQKLMDKLESALDAKSDESVAKYFNDLGYEFYEEPELEMSGEISNEGGKLTFHTWFFLKNEATYLTLDNGPANDDLDLLTFSDNFLEAA